MSAVISEYLNLPMTRFQTRAYASWWAGRSWRALISMFGFPVVLRRAEVGLVNVHLSEGGSFIREGFYILVSRALGLPTVATLHGANFRHFMARRRRLVRLILRNASNVAVLSDDDMTAVTALVPSVAVRKIYNPVPEGHLERSGPTNGMTVLFAGEVGQRKGFDQLLASWPRVQEALGTAKLIVCGPLIDQDPTDWPSGCNYLGVLPRDAVIDLVNSSAVVCLPSRAEVQPMILLEAMASGTPFVSTRTGFWQDLEASGGGIVLQEGWGTNELSSAIVKLLLDERLAERCGASGRAWHAGHSAPARVAAELEHMYVDAIGLEP